MPHAYTAKSSYKRKRAIDHAFQVLNVSRAMATRHYTRLRGYPQERVRPRRRFKPTVDPVARVAAQRAAVQERLAAQTRARNRRAAYLIALNQLRRQQHNTNALLYHKLGFVPNYEWK